MGSTTCHRSYLQHDFDYRYRNLITNPGATRVFKKTKIWVGSTVVKDVLNLEYLPKHLSKEDRMLNRMDLWAEACRVDTPFFETWEQFTASYCDASDSLKKKPQLSVCKKGWRFTKSSDEIYLPENQEHHRIIKKGIFNKTSLSANDVRSRFSTSTENSFESFKPISRFVEASKLFGCVFQGRNKGKKQKAKRPFERKKKDNNMRKEKGEYFENLDFEII